VTRYMAGKVSARQLGSPETLGSTASAVVLVSHGFQPDYEAGFANGLARNGARVTLISSDQTLYDRLEPTIEALNLRGSQDANRPSWRKALNLLWYWLRLLSLVARRHPVVHLTGLFSFSNFSASWADKTWAWECRVLRTLSSRLVLTVHNIVPHDRDTPEVRRHLAEAYRIPDLLIVHTARARQRLIDEFAVDASRILIMGHGLDAIVQPDARTVEATRRALGLAPDQRLVLFLGWVRRYKGADLLLRAVPLVRSRTRVLIAGNCIDSDHRQEVEQLLATPAIAERASWEFGYLSESRVSELLAATDVLVMPYREIDQSGVLFAALRHGVPVVAFDVGSLRDYLPEGTGLVVPANDVPALAAAIEAVEPAQHARSRIHALAHRFRWDETVKSLLPAYRPERAK
jgi:glycosyltransferase involved in cell wall biosynthesis